MSLLEHAHKCHDFFFLHKFVTPVSLKSPVGHDQMTTSHSSSPSYVHLALVAKGLSGDTLDAYKLRLNLRSCLRSLILRNLVTSHRDMHISRRDF